VPLASVQWPSASSPSSSWSPSSSAKIAEKIKNNCQDTGQAAQRERCREMRLVWLYWVFDTLTKGPRNRKSRKSDGGCSCGSGNSDRHWQVNIDGNKIYMTTLAIFSNLMSQADRLAIRKCPSDCRWWTRSWHIHMGPDEMRHGRGEVSSNSLKWCANKAHITSQKMMDPRWRRLLRGFNKCKQVGSIK